MVIISYKMKKAVDNDPVQLILELSSILTGIFPDTVDTYKEISGQSVTFTIVESNDIGKIIVLEISLVYIQNIIVRTEDYRYVTRTLYLALGNKPQPPVIKCLAFKDKTSKKKL